MKVEFQQYKSSSYFQNYVYKTKLICIKKGSIERDDTDCIVVVQDNHLRFQSEISLKISFHGGENIVNECQQFLEEKGKLNYGEVIHTHSGNLSCDYIIHGSLPSSPKPI